MTIIISEAHGAQIEELIPLLLLAEPWEPALRWGLAHLSDAVYRVEDSAGQLVGAFSMQWRDDPCEIEELAVTPERQGQGLGKQIINWIIAEARRRGKCYLLVGTPNTSLNNIAFYQKVGFRMDHIRHDYFQYYRMPRYENSIQVCDLLVFRYDLTPVERRARAIARRRIRS